MDLNKLKKFEEESNIKINASELARELGVDRRTVRKYIDGFQKKTKRKRSTQFDKYYETIKLLLEDNIKIFKYKSCLYWYMCDFYSLEAPESSFRRYINKTPEFKEYFEKNKLKSASNNTTLRFETQAGKQAQVDWKESMSIVLNTGEVVEMNIFVYILSYSRFRIYRVSLNKTREILKEFLVNSFEGKRQLIDVHREMKKV